MKNRVGTVGLALFFALSILPIAASLAYAALYSVGATGLLTTGPTLEFWREVLASGEVWSSLALSFYVALAVVAVATAIALALSLLLRDRLERGLASYALYLPLALPWTVAAFLTFQLLSGGGLLARALVTLGLASGPEGVPRLVLDRWGFGIIATHIFLAVPFLTLLFAKLHQSERVDELTALATSLGAGRRACLRRVTLPLLLRAAGSNLALLFIVVLGSYEIPLLLGRQSPQMISVFTLRKYAMFDVLEKPQAYALALVYSGFVLALLLLLDRRGAFRDEPG